MKPKNLKSPFSWRIGFITVAVVLAAPPAYGNGNTLGDLLGSILQQAEVQNAAKSWAAVDQQIQYCLISRYNIIPGQVAQQGITAEDSRVAGYIQACQTLVAEERLREEQRQRADEAQRTAQAAAAREARQEQHAREVAAKAQAETRHKELVTKYGTSQADAIEAGNVIVGMNRDAVIATVGRPSSKEVIPPNDELWTYGSMRISISNGKVTHVGH